MTSDALRIHLAPGEPLTVDITADGRADVTVMAAGAPFLTELDIAAAPRVHAVVVAGSSVALGYLADGPAWPDLLQARLSGRRPGVTVVNESIGATRLLLDNSAGPSVLARERTDLLAVSGVRTIVLADLINDIQQEPHEYQPVHITDGITTFVRLAHERHVRVVVSTIPPYGGFERFSRQGEACRQQVNDFVRRSGIPDAVLDLDALLRDPSEPDRLASRFDAGDHLHQTEAGQIAISEAIERVLRWAAGRRSGR